MQTNAILMETARSFVRLTFLNTACYRSMVRHLYAVAVQSLPSTCFIALIMGSITVHYLLSILTGLGAYDRIGDYLIDAMLHEIAPVTVAVILMVRAGTATLSETALMAIRGELDTLSMLDIRLRDYLFLPRIMAFAVAGPCLTLAFSLVGLLGGFLVMGYLQDITLANYLDQIAEALVPSDLLYITAKPFLFATLVAAISVQRGLNIQAKLTDLPRQLIQGLMYALAAIVGVEVIFILFT
ncbi:ABC transporter permease protein [Desulfovibrio ferrophilus]|uniref:ABC transporter permease protein n=1 Tax=Desulfovibrio ferrophilus TaxID=241368 RepID=A0A2Z6AWN8_9BACT|nr:ABC transporter permease protein [Desulfovibrio ferrophilus]